MQHCTANIFKQMRRVNVHNAVAIGNSMAAEFNVCLSMQGSHNGDHDKSVENIKIGDISVYGNFMEEYL